MRRVKLTVEFDVYVDPPESESAGEYAERCLVAYFNCYPHDRVKPASERWKRVKASDSRPA